MKLKKKTGVSIYFIIIIFLLAGVSAFVFFSNNTPLGILTQDRAYKYDSAQDAIAECQKTIAKWSYSTGDTAYTRNYLECGFDRNDVKQPDGKYVWKYNWNVRTRYDIDYGAKVIDNLNNMIAYSETYDICEPGSVVEHYGLGACKPVPENNTALINSLQENVTSLQNTITELELENAALRKQASTIAIPGESIGEGTGIIIPDEKPGFFEWILGWFK